MQERAFLVVSPHFDDAALSCGHWLTRHPRAVVATVCSGKPGVGVPPCSWDAGSGFRSADDAANGRRAEDEAAMSVVGAQQRLLGFLDVEYRLAIGRQHEDPAIRGSFERLLAASIGNLIDDLSPEQCLAPLGLHHTDHVATGRATRTALWDRPGCQAIAYADLPYAITFPRTVTQKLEEIRAEGWRIAECPMPLPSSVDPKRQMVSCYGSQLCLLRRSRRKWRAALRLGAERFWQLTPEG